MKLETNWVRIISDKTTPPRTEKIGKEYKICRNDFLYDENSDMSAVLVIDDNHKYQLFYKSDVRFLTPIKFKDRHIAIGDKIKWEDKWYKIINFNKTSKQEELYIENEGGAPYPLFPNEIEDHDPGIETDEDYIEIDGEKWSKEDIKQKLKEKDKRISYLEDKIVKIMKLRSELD
jgi:hypothetical protein